MDYITLGLCREFLVLSNIALDKINKVNIVKEMEFVIEKYREGQVWDLLIRNTIITYKILSHCIVYIKNIVRVYDSAGYYIEQTAKLLRRYNEIPGLFYEQAGYMMLYRSLHRKFAQRMFLAGEIYCQQGLLYNALYCFGICHNVYENKYWSLILTRLYSLLINIFTQIGNNLNLFLIYKKLFITYITIQPNKNHTELYKPFIRAGSELSKNIKDLDCLYFPSLMLIQTNAVDVETASDQFISNGKEQKVCKSNGLYNMSQSWISLGRMLNENVDKVQEKNLIKSREETLRDLLFYDEMDKRIELYYKRQRIVHCLEPLRVRASIKNYLNLIIKVTRIQLLCHYTDNSSDQYKVVPLAFTLSPFESKEIAISVIPQTTGEFSIDGIEWEVEHAIYGNYFFKRKIILVIKESTGQLIIIPEIPLRSQYFNNEIMQYPLTLKNIGTQPITNITLQTDHPIFLGFKQLHFDWTLTSSEQKIIKITLRAMKTEEVKILFRYSSSNYKFTRYTRILHSFNVIPSISISAKCYCTSNIFYEYALDVAVKQFYTNYKYFSLKEIRVNEQWKATLKNFNGDSNNAIVVLKKGKGNKVVLSEEKVDYLSSISSHIKEYDSYHGISLDNSIRALLLWRLKVKKQVVYGINDIITPLHPKEQFPLTVRVECVEEVKHDYRMKA